MKALYRRRLADASDGNRLGTTDSRHSHSLNISNVSHSFRVRDRVVEALNDVNLTIEPDEFICLLGPSGCGKSTLLKAIAGLIVPTSGNIELNGQHVRGPGLDRGVVFQEPALFPWLRVTQNVQFGLRNAGWDRATAQARAEEVLEVVGLAAKAQQHPHQLSGGQAQRVAVARAWASTDCSVLLMDEPFAAVDAIGRTKLQDHLVNTWRHEPRTVIFVTHDIEEAVYLADRIVLMCANPGRIEEIYSVPVEQRRVRDAIGSAELRREITARMHQAAGGHVMQTPNRDHLSAEPSMELSVEVVAPLRTDVT
jgi:NitT/TauT family transport system ATP-binding protein